MERLNGRPFHLGVRFATLGLVGLSVAVACSDDSSPEPTTTVAGGGQGGMTQTEPSGGKSGSTAGGGLGGGGSAPVEVPPSGAGGEGGEGGVPPTLGEACSTCGATECKDLFTSCEDTPACATWLGCVSVCTDADCVTACDAANSDVARVYAGIYACLCDSCDAACSGADACGKKTCSEAGALEPVEAAPPTLAGTGLFVSDGAGGEGGGGPGAVGAAGAGGASGGGFAMLPDLAPYVRGYVPSYPLWADGATKQRNVYIPPCSVIDTSDMDHWKFPVGTRFWKTFRVGQTLVETRFLHRFGSGALDWTYAAYRWDPNVPNDPSAAKLVDAALGEPNANDTTHDIPTVAQCKQCHNGLPEKVLGFGAFQLSHRGVGKDLDITKLSDWGWLSDPAPQGFVVPGDDVQRKALGYLHGNCGGCHSDSSPTPAASPQILRLSVTKLDYADTDTVLTTVGVPTVRNTPALQGKPRIDPQAPDTSTILLRMKDRATYPMPPIGSEVPDTDGGIVDVTAWVNSIPKP
jgi:hypothetical protein